MAKKSAGILLYRYSTREMLEVLLVHPGGPFWAKKDAGVWSIPKGEFEEGEDSLAAARREFEEETGQAVSGEFIELSPVRYSGGKTIYAFAVAGSFDPAALKSNTFSLEWPPRSGKRQDFPEVDRGAWFDLDTAAEKINPHQAALLDQVKEKLSR